MAQFASEIRRASLVILNGNVSLMNDNFQSEAALITELQSMD